MRHLFGRTLNPVSGEIFRNRVDIISGGYPCQPFSAAGNRKGSHDPRHLWPFIQGAIGIIRPRYCFFENVEGHLTLGFKDVCHDLGELGYELTAGIFSAAECGAPHQRKRVFILAHSRREHREVSPGWELSAEQVTGGNGETRRAWPARPGEHQHEWEEPRECIQGRKEGSTHAGGCVQTELADTGHSESSGLDGEAEGQLRESRGESAPQDCGDGELGNRECGRRESGNGGRPAAEEPGAGCKQSAGRIQAEHEIKSKLGGATDGPTSGLDSTANRVDRLRLLGNGVVPDTCEVAFRTLYKELGK